MENYAIPRADHLRRGAFAIRYDPGTKTGERHLSERSSRYLGSLSNINNTAMIAIGLEGSANKLGVGIILHPAKGGPAQILSNIRHTFHA